VVTKSIKNIMKKLFSIQFLGSIASIIALMFFIYYQFFVRDVPTLEIRTISNEELTHIPNENKLNVTYEYEGIEVNELSKIRFSVINSGSKTLVGKTGGDLLEEMLPLIYKGDKNLHNVYNIQIINQNFPIELNSDSTNYYLKFKQWRSNEFVELQAYIGNNNSIDVSAESFTIDERSIIDGEVIESQYSSNQIQTSPKLIDSFPRSLRNTLWWLAIVGYLIMILTSIPAMSKAANTEGNEHKGIKLFIYILWTIILIIFLIPFLWMVQI
jgi:hypothetical protein